jgi:hypothetical protein
MATVFASYKLCALLAFLFLLLFFVTKPKERCGSDAFSVKIFQAWRKVNGGEIIF